VGPPACRADGFRAAPYRRTGRARSRCRPCAARLRRRLGSASRRSFAEGCRPRAARLRRGLGASCGEFSPRAGSLVRRVFAEGWEPRAARFRRGLGAPVGLPTD